MGNVSNVHSAPVRMRCQVSAWKIQMRYPTVKSRVHRHIDILYDAPVKYDRIIYNYLVMEDGHCSSGLRPTMSSHSHSLPTHYSKIVFLFYVCATLSASVWVALLCCFLFVFHKPYFSHSRPLFFQPKICKYNLFRYIFPQRNRQQDISMEIIWYPTMQRFKNSAWFNSGHKYELRIRPILSFDLI